MLHVLPPPPPPHLFLIPLYPGFPIEHAELVWLFFLLWHTWACCIAYNNKLPLRKSPHRIPKQSVHHRDGESPLFKGDESNECDWPWLSQPLTPTAVQGTLDCAMCSHCRLHKNRVSIVLCWGVGLTFKWANEIPSSKHFRSLPASSSVLCWTGHSLLRTPNKRRYRIRVGRPETDLGRMFIIHDETNKLPWASAAKAHSGLVSHNLTFTWL